MPSPLKKTSPVKQPRQQPFEDSDEDGVQGFTLRLTQVQVSEEKKGGSMSNAKKNKYASSSHYRNGSMAAAYGDQEIEEEAAYTESFAIQTRVNTIVGANGGFTIKGGSNNKRKIINVIGSPSHVKGNSRGGNSSSIR